MTPRLSLSLLAPLFALALVACSPKAPAPDAATPAATPAATGTPAPPAASTTAATPDTTPAPTPGPIVPPSGPRPVAGTDYIEIPNGERFDPGTPGIEVAEVFNFICPACARFQPTFAAWKAKLPADVHVSYVPADFNAQWKPYAQAFFAAQAMGLDARSHDAVYDAIHLKHTLPGEGDTPDAMAVARFYAQYGANPSDVYNTMQSFAVAAKLNRARQFMLEHGVEGTPTIIVNGKYRVLGTTYDDMLRITDWLIADERAKANAK